MKIIQVKDCNDCPFCAMGGYEGEYGIEPNVPYVVKDGKLVKK